MGFCVAIDGPAAAGKGTISKAIAAHFGFAHLDTGLLYRGVGHKVMRGQDPLEAAQALTAQDLDDPALRSAEVAKWASKVAVLPEVRRALVDFQRAFAARAGGAVLDGRDIGTVICPQAQAKIFVTASAQTRAERRHKELVARGEAITLAQVLADVEARDARDRSRATAPLVAAKDADLVDTSDLSIDAAVAHVIAIVAAKIAAQS